MALSLENLDRWPRRLAARQKHALQHPLFVRMVPTDQAAAVLGLGVTLIWCVAGIVGILVAVHLNVQALIPASWLGPVTTLGLVTYAAPLFLLLSLLSAREQACQSS